MKVINLVGTYSVQPNHPLKPDSYSASEGVAHRLRRSRLLSYSHEPLNGTDESTPHPQIHSSGTPTLNCIIFNVILLRSFTNIYVDSSLLPQVFMQRAPPAHPSWLYHSNNT